MTIILNFVSDQNKSFYQYIGKNFILSRLAPSGDSDSESHQQHLCEFTLGLKMSKRNLDEIFPKGELKSLVVRKQILEIGKKKKKKKKNAFDTVQTSNSVSHVYPLPNSCLKFMLW